MRRAGLGTAAVAASGLALAGFGVAAAAASDHAPAPVPGTVVVVDDAASPAPPVVDKPVEVTPLAPIDGADCPGCGLG